ncbi:uncharacterized protein LOC109725244 [Ananas comosus]|uniref:Uncharacterized protein LOC109725244 n=1 Tax=Ananas comosus TaxID=4615 RepID=A0A6P5GQ61_ANACO|nr:uncharacterized protein LOC109725244 [Ananas comosus]
MRRGWSTVAAAQRRGRTQASVWARAGAAAAGRGGDGSASGLRRPAERGARARGSRQEVILGGGGALAAVATRLGQARPGLQQTAGAAAAAPGDGGGRRGRSQEHGAIPGEGLQEIDLQKKILENSEGLSSLGKIAWEGDRYSQILGKEKRGYVRGLGLGPSANEIFKARFEGLKMTTFDEITVEKEMRQMKEHMERLEKQIQEQNNTIIELKHMVQCLATGRAIECGQLIEPSIGRASEVEECSARNTSDSVHHNGSSKCKKSTCRKKIASDASASHI